MTLNDVKFEIEWQGADESIRSPELRATWARLLVSVRGDIVTLVEDLSTHTLRRSINVSLYPMAEWIAFNWWLLRFDSRPHRRSSSDDRRRLVSAGDGFIWPDLRIVPQGRVSELVWRPDGAPRIGAQVRHLGRGRAFVVSRELADGLASLVDAVVDRLLDAGISDTPLQAEWGRTTSVDSDESVFCEASARLGLDPFSEGLDLAEVISSVLQELDPELRNDFLDAADRDRLPDSLTWIKANQEAIPEGEWPFAGADLVELRRTTSMIPRHEDPQPWVVGWEAARRIRPALVKDLAQPLPSLDLEIAEHPMSGRRLIGLGRATENAAGLVLARSFGKRAQRFHAARSLWHALTTAPGSPFLLTGAPSAPQRVGRAFAAELLAPANGLADFLDGDYSTEAIEDAASLYRAPPDVVRHQVENQLPTG